MTLSQETVLDLLERKFAFLQLQRIENKFDPEDWNYTKAQKARNKLCCERSPETNTGQEEIVRNKIKPGESCLSCRENGTSVSPVWPQSQSFEGQAVRSDSAGRMHLPCSGEPTSAPCSSCQMEAQDGRAAAGTHAAVETLCVLSHRGSLSDQVSTGKKSPAGEMGGAPHTVQHVPTSLADSKQAAPCAVWRHSCSLSLCHSPLAERLEGLRRRSPDNKLEQLKGRIQKQKQRQQCPKQPCANHPMERLPPRPLMQKVRKVASAPPAPVYRGFSAVRLKAALSSTDKEPGRSEPARQKGDSKSKSPGQREKCRMSRTQKHKHEQSSSKSPVPKKTLKEKGSSLCGASAWREGQKLVKKLLGPPPKFQKLGSKSTDDSEPSKEFIATPQMEQSSRENDAPGGGDHMWNSLLHKSCQTTPGSSTETASNALTREAKQILRDLHLQNQSCEEYRNAKQRKGTRTRKAEDSESGPETNSSSTEINGITLSDYGRHKSRYSLTKTGTEPRNCSRGKSASFSRGKGSNSPGQKVSEKENVNQSAKKRINRRKSHSYSLEEVHEFMHRKIEERKKKNLEEKKALKQARETKAQRLQELYRKQKEAFAKKSCCGAAQTLNRGPLPVTQSSQYKLAQEQTMKRSPEQHFMELAHKTSCGSLRREEQRWRDLHPKTTPQAMEKFDFPSSLASRSGFHSPLNLKDLAVSPSPTRDLPPQSFFLLPETAKSDPWDSVSEDTSSLPLYRDTQARVKAIHCLARELGERIEIATERLKTNRLQVSGDNGGEECLPPSWWSPCSKPKAPKSEQNETLDIRTLLDAPSPNGVWISLVCARDGLDKSLCLASPEGVEAQERTAPIQAVLSNTDTVKEELPGISNSAMHGRAPEDMCKGSVIKKGSDAETCLLRGKLITSIASPTSRFLTGSPERKSANQRNRSTFDALSQAQNKAEIVSPSPKRSLRTALSHGFESCTSPARRIGLQKESDDKFGRDPRCIDSEERYRDHLENLQQTSLRLAQKLKADQLQQQRRLAVLQEKAKLEAQESQRSLEELLKHQLAGLNGSQTRSPLRAKLKRAKQDQREYQLEGDPEGDESAEDCFRLQSAKQSALNTDIDCNVTDARKATERQSPGEMNLHSSTQQQGSLSAKRGDALDIHQPLKPLPPSVNQSNSETLTAVDLEDSSEKLDSTSQWSEVSPFCGGFSSFCRFSLTMAEQYLREEELRAQHRRALLRLREKALQEKTKAELAWLEHQKGCLDNRRDREEVSAIAGKQRKILAKLKQEQAEIQHLRNIYRAAHRERKLLLSQQREILLMQQSTAKLQRELHGLAGRSQFTNSSADIEETITQRKTGSISSPAISCMLAEVTACSQRPVLSRNGDSCVQLNNTQRRKIKSFPTGKEKTLLHCRKRAEVPERWKQSLGVQAPEVLETMANDLCDVSDQSTGSPVMEKNSENTEINDQCHARLPSEHPNSAEMDGATLTLVAREDKPYEFLESDHKEKKFVSNHTPTLKDNEVPSRTPSILLILADVPVNEEEEAVKVFAPCDKNPVEDKWLIKHVDNNVCDPPDDEPDLKTCSEGLASMVASSESHDSSLQHESVNSCQSLPEFHKVSAVWINVSESSVSDSELEAEATDISMPEEFTLQQLSDGDNVFSNPLTEAQRAVSDGNELLSSDICVKQVPHDDCNREASLLCHGSEKHPRDVSEYECAYESYSVTISRSEKPTLSASRKEEPFSFWLDNIANGRNKPCLEASTLLPCSENSSVNKIPSQETSEQVSDSSSSSLLYNDEFCTEENIGQDSSASATSKVKKDGESYDLSVGQPKVEFMWSLPERSLKHPDAILEQLNNCPLFPPKKSMTNNQMPLFPEDSSLASRDVSGLEETKTDHMKLLIEGHVSEKPNEIPPPYSLMPTCSEEAPTEARVSSSDKRTFQRVAAHDQNNSPTEGQTFKKSEMMPLCPTSSKKQMPQERGSSSESEDDMIFISDEVLPPIPKDALSEILSPVDEVLSYGSVDLPSSNKNDFLWYSETLPPPPEEGEGAKSDDTSFSMGDFPSPPEPMTFSEVRESHCLPSEVVSGQMNEALSLGDGPMPEELPPPSPELTAVYSAQDETVSGCCWGKDVISGRKEDLEHVAAENETTSQPCDSPHVSIPIVSSQAIKRPECVKGQIKPFLTLSKSREDNDDPLLSFEVGDRVLVKPRQPGTLMFKGCTHFGEGYWAGVALDKPEGDHDGTYGGVKYFVCTKYCGIFVRPDQISHLLEGNEKSSDYPGDENSFSDDGSSGGKYKWADDNQQGTGYTEQNSKDTYSVKGSAWKENRSRSHMSMPSGKEHKGQFPSDNQYMSNEFTYQACLESDKETTGLTHTKQKTVAEHVLPMRNKGSNPEEINKSRCIGFLLKDQDRSRLANDITSRLTKNLLYDMLIAFSGTTEHKTKCTFERELQNHLKGLKKRDNHSASLSEQSAGVFDALLCDLATLRIHGSHIAQTVAEKIVAKFVDDAVKEYKKIKRKQGAKADAMLQVSSEIPLGMFPFLIKILDAGVFGSSEDFDQLSSVQHAKELKSRRQTHHRLDHWHSAPWNKIVEVPLLLPHNSSHVKLLSAYVIDELWTPQNICSDSSRINVPKDFEFNDISNDDLEGESKRIYNQVIFDLTYELLHTEYQVTANPHPLPWLKEKLGSCHSRCIRRKTDVSEVKSFIQGEIIKIMNLEKNSLEMKRKLLKMTKYRNCKRDHVDPILIQDLHKEESQWIDYAEDELTVKMRVTEDIFDSLLLDTIEVLKKLSLKRTCD
ncbi:coiled-coil domain-containing protein 187 [Carettochelys insculpta]|uniref:coiled-coil domain-containing protein 187 n=1 Tax=Carettochelys insculpta TaxID=44489 RepID=UPI003EBD1C58